MPTILDNLGEGTPVPTGGVQFGNRYFLTGEDWRPRCVYASALDSTLKAYSCGIKAPVTAPTTAASGTNSSNIALSSVFTIAYAFYSSRRGVMSRLSPEATYTVPASPNPAKKITLSAFESPRDDAQSNDIDQIWIGVQIVNSDGGGNEALMTVQSTILDVSDFDFVNATIDLDLGVANLDVGAFNMSDADQYNDIPPAVKYVARYGERMWFGGQRKKVEFSGKSVTVTKSQSFRGETVAKLTMSGTGGWDDSHYWMSVYVDGKYLGEFWDYTSRTVAYVLADVPANITATTLFQLVGHNDRIYPSSWHNLTIGNVPTVFPESINLANRVVLNAVLDEGEQLKGLVAAQDYLYVIFNNTCQQIIDDKAVGSPNAMVRTVAGQVGTTAQRSITVNGQGGLFWWGEEGPIEAASGAAGSISHTLGINQFSKGGQWLSLSSLPNMVACYSRQNDGYITGNMTVNSTANYWALLSVQPQAGLWLFDGQAITSNLIEYPDSNGQGVILAGDAYRGRIKRLLTPNTVTDLPAASDTVAAYSCTYREGWMMHPTGMPCIPTRLRILGLILPTPSTFAMTVTLWGSNYPVRNDADITSLASTGQAATSTITLSAEYEVPKDISIAPIGRFRFWSVGFTWNSTAGQTSPRPMELIRWQLLFEGEKTGRD